MNSQHLYQHPVPQQFLYSADNEDLTPMLMSDHVMNEDSCWGEDESDYVEESFSNYDFDSFDNASFD